MQVIDRGALERLVHVLAEEGYTVIGPTVRDGAIVYDRLASTAELPEGWTDDQGPGTYRLKKREDRALFGYAVGPQSWKPWLRPAELRLWSARRTNGAVVVDAAQPPAPRYALLGVRPCELRAIQIQDRVLRDGVFADPAYDTRREGCFVIAINCGSPAATCFCASLDTGPGVRRGYDLALTELIEAGSSRFTIETGSDRGTRMLERLPRRPATPDERAAAEAVVREAAGHMGRTLDTTGLARDIAAAREHPQWEDIEQRCLACGNCTMVCPTCFCTRVEDTSDLTGDVAERWQRWDSCFAVDFTHMHGGSVRRSGASRYRQWLTHKLSAWHDQFGDSGCVGCGRCITWCPVGIDLTREVAALRQAPRARTSSSPAGSHAPSGGTS